MTPPADRYKPVRGKTYSLFGNNSSSDLFYREIEKHLDQLLLIIPSEQELLHNFQQISRSKKKFSNWVNNNPGIHEIFFDIRQYITDLEKHLRQRPFYKFWYGVLSTREHQYLTYFLEFALVNRINREKFRESNFKLALLPHCIRISIPDCKARSDGLDMVCVKCSEGCFIREITETLEKNNIRAYIWMQMNFSPAIRKLLKEHRTLGVLGIACIPELIAGMRKCLRHRLPVVGLPLDANRCIRWMGDFYENSVNLERLELLVS